MELDSKHHSNKIHHLTKFHENPLEQHKFIARSMIMITHDINHQQQHLITAITTTNHEFINNSLTTTLYFINFE